MIFLPSSLTGSLRVENVVLDDLPHHPPPEVGHVGLVERDLRPAREVLGELAREHAAVGGVVLLRNLLHHHHLRDRYCLRYNVVKVARMCNSDWAATEYQNNAFSEPFTLLDKLIQYNPFTLGHTGSFRRFCFM